MINITIDGHSGCGKSSTARKVAEILNFIYLDTGAMYRGVALYFTQNHLDFNNFQSEELKKVHLDFYFPQS